MVSFNQFLIDDNNVSRQAKDAIKAAGLHRALSGYPFNPAEACMLLDVFKDDPNFVNIRDGEGNTPLHNAARYNRMDVLNFLLSTKNIDPLLYDKEGKKASQRSWKRDAIQILSQAETRKIAEMEEAMREVPPPSRPASPKGSSTFFAEEEKRREQEQTTDTSTPDKPTHS